MSKKKAAHNLAANGTLLKLQNLTKVGALRRRYPQRFRLRAASEATPDNLRAQAASAARLADLDARVGKGASGRERAAPQWDELRTWDPGD